MVNGAARLLVVDDDSEVREALGRALKLEGFAVTLAADGAAALEAVRDAPHDALVLDVAMPGVDGLAVARALRAAEDRTPILMLTARDAIADRVFGLNAGADDYLVKPFALVELVARVNALLRRAAAQSPPPPPVLECGDLALDLAARQVVRAGRRADLTKTEFELLELLLRNAGRVVTRELIIDRIWGYDFGPGSNSLEVFVSTLRRKTEIGDRPRVIHTIRGVGYSLRECKE
ncbi:MAG TPA: response regulator transcription factor [Actinocrinis sp.]|uniref:response regulator transcription factor n=1 Tax=Actinocrinis sp. TaxID=1920516 RepID=UPI002DDDB56F|nr:response regulator transcription factor [Actinocrinis sp.]HEV2345119.1 response regulator transcription factor [Actinocrinis sp.]